MKLKVVLKYEQNSLLHETEQIEKIAIYRAKNKI